MPKRRRMPKPSKPRLPKPAIAIDEGSGTAVAPTELVAPKLNAEAVEAAPLSVTCCESVYVPELLADTAAELPEP